jgi:hypothetical protein
MQKYEDPLKALVHHILETYIEEAFKEFIGEKIGKQVICGSDGAVIKEYRNGYQYSKHSMIC